MIRKLIQLSPSTAVVSLPASWIKKNKLVKGTSLEVDERDNRIVISGENSKKKSKEISLDVSKLNKQLMLTIVDGAYISGYDKIKLFIDNKEMISFMTKAVRFYLGLIIYEENTKEVILKDIAEDSKTDLNKIINHIFNLIIAMMEDSLTAIEEKDWELLKNIKKRDFNINSYVSYCLRHLNKFGYKDFSKIGIMHTYIKILEISADKVSALFTGIGIKEIKISKDEKTIKKIVSMYRNLQRLHPNFKREKLLEIEKEREKIKKNISKIDVHLKVYFTEILELFFDIVELEIQLNS
jgi:phosphate uptake regulator